MDYTKRTNVSDLVRLCDDLNIPSLGICRLHELPRMLKSKASNIIVNLDSYGLGSHWVALYRPKKVYFDSYAEEKPIQIPKDYTRASTKKELQSLESTDCGGLCCLWLYYMNFKTNEEYYDLFKDVYM